MAYASLEKGATNWPTAILALILSLMLLGNTPALAAPAKSPNPRPNRLIRETSPYLRLHANNPVDWYPWGQEALERARRENKPIFLSIGYSTCHWCHVMARESFENPEIAKFLNQNFICIKVDREERPDLDDTYMQAALLLNSRGGWPLSVFLTPDLKPFFAGTYFSPKAFTTLLRELLQAYRQRPAEVAEAADELAKDIRNHSKVSSPSHKPEKKLLNSGFQKLAVLFDADHGGFGSAPKFPQALELNFLLHYYRFAGEPKALEMVDLSLEKMARGGIYDQLGGGFHRYATDAAWVVPHFEKMLYDNALLVPVYLSHYQVTQNQLSRRIAKETLDFVLRVLHAPSGGFFSALDAQSEGKEGKFYLWSQTEVEEVVGKEAAPVVSAALGITQTGNWHGANIPTRPLAEKELAVRFSLAPEKVQQMLNPALEALWQARKKRVSPARDEKVITAWNGLMISAMAKGAQVLGDNTYYQAAAQDARFLLKNLVKDNRLHRIYSQGQASVPGFLEDYAFLAAGLLDLFETDFDPQWLVQAQQLFNRMEELFLDPASGVYFSVGKDQKTPLVRSQSIYDRSMPSGNSVAALVSLKLYHLTGEKRFHQRAQAILSNFQGEAQLVTLAFAQLLTTQALYLAPLLELTVVGPPEAQQTRELLQEMYRRFLPERRLVLKNPQEAARIEKIIHGVQFYTLQDGQPAAYICLDQACLPPLVSPGQLAARLSQLDKKSNPLTQGLKTESPKNN
jgi:uncharacterized protein YyaL (SSP411 family)